MTQLYLILKTLLLKIEKARYAEKDFILLSLLVAQVFPRLFSYLQILFPKQCYS